MNEGRSSKTRISRTCLPNEDKLRKHASRLALVTLIQYAEGRDFPASR